MTHAEKAAIEIMERKNDAISITSTIQTAITAAVAEKDETIKGLMESIEHFKTATVCFKKSSEIASREADEAQSKLAEKDAEIEQLGWMCERLSQTSEISNHEAEQLERLTAWRDRK